MTDAEIKTHIRRQYYKNIHDPIGLNVRGTPRKNRTRTELAGLGSSTARYRTGYSRMWRAKKKALTHTHK